MLKKAKMALLGLADHSGLFALLARSGWRRQRLLILCYHGISLEDEHLWDPSLYLPADLFQARMELLRAGGYNVLDLTEAVERLRSGTLPPKAVAITFDDGHQDFYLNAWPILRQFGYPATLYLTTYYALDQRPVFDMFCSYLLWKGGQPSLEAADLLGDSVPLRLDTPEGRKETMRRIFKHVKLHMFTASEKEEFTRKLAGKLGLDYEALRARKLLHIMSPDQVREIAAAGVDIQLHTHRHRVPEDADLFRREIEDNRRGIAELLGERQTIHFCYPSGVTFPECLPWLEELGIRSATTCEHGLADAGTHPLLLPRLLDTSNLSPLEFRGWLSGFSSLLPQRHY
jgi:peptidoglycan/xylan/chitin deacetylase (PgdA/CDA1 family)